MVDERSLTAKIADELRRNDECGPGPVSDQEYLADAAAIVRIVNEHQTRTGAGFEPCACVRFYGDSDPDGPGTCKSLPREPEPPLVQIVMVPRDSRTFPRLRLYQESENPAKDEKQGEDR